MGLRDIRYVRCCRHHREDQARFRIDADVCLHAEFPLVALLGLVHVGVPFTRPVLRRARRVDDGRIDNGAVTQQQALLAKIGIHRQQDLLSQSVTLGQVTEIEDGGLVRNRAVRQRQPRKFAHRRAVVERFFHRRIGHVMPLLHEVDAQHGLQRIETTALTGLGINRFDDGLDLRPGNHLGHLGKEDLPPCLLPFPLELGVREAHLVGHRTRRPVGSVNACILPVSPRSARACSDFP